MNTTDRRQESRRLLYDPNTADNHEVRLGIVRRIESGEITPEQGKAELAAIKRAGRKAGKAVWG